MSQRLAKDALLHPLTGEEITPVGYINGRPIMPVLGGAEKDDDDGEEEDDDDSEDDDDESEDDDDDDDSKNKKKSSKSDDPKDKRIHDLSEENARRRVKGRETQKALDIALAEIAELKKGGKSKPKKDGEEDDSDALAELQKQVNDLQAKTEKSDADIRERDIRIAFLSNNKYEWINPETALKLADLKDVEVEDGVVNKNDLTEALDALAKSDSYLLKPKADSKKKSDDDDEDDDEDDDDKKPSGARTGSSRRKKSKGPNREAYEKQYPALAR